MSLLRFCFAALLLLAAVPASAQTFHLSGKVIDARGGQAVPHSVVELNPTTQRGASLSIVADDEGRFAFTNLAAGKYQLSASHRGYLTQSYQQHDQFSTAIAVGRDVPADDLLFPLTPQSILFGTVTDEAGEPVRRAQVRLFANGGPDRGQQARAGQVGMTDDLGNYELAGLLPGDYYLAVSAQPWYAQGGIGRFAESPDRDAEKPQDTALDVAYPTTLYLNATDTDEATPIPLRGGERLEINLTLNPLHAMRLHLTLPPAKDTGYNISLSQSIFGMPEFVSTSMVVKEDGDIVIDGVLPGHYDVTVNQFGSNFNRSSHFATDVAPGSTTLSPSEMANEVIVTGRVLGIEERQGNAGISLYSSHPQRNYSARLEASGEFSLIVEPGNYEVIGNIPQMYLARVASPNAAVHGRILEVKSGASPRLEIVAGKGFAQIDGFVTAGKQRPGGIMVLLAPENPADNRILFRRDQSDSDGSFTLADIIPGRYHLYAIEHGFDLQWTNPEVLRAFAKKSVALEVHAGEKLNQTVELQTEHP